MVKQEALRELERIRNEDPDGVLHPEEVVNAARSTRSPLHDYFTWDNDEAAERYRLIQAKKLIRVAVTTIPRTNEKVRAYVSLPRDRNRKKDGEGGYRLLEDVLASDALRVELMEDAARELRSFRRKFHRLMEIYKVRGLSKAINRAIQILEEDEVESDGEE